jgi:hypothetical protein
MTCCRLRRLREFRCAVSAEVVCGGGDVAFPVNCWSAEEGGTEADVGVGWGIGPDGAISGVSRGAGVVMVAVAGMGGGC